MRKAFEDVSKLSKLEKVGSIKKLCKLAEESGELMQVICRHVGMKANTMSESEMREEALGEVADVIQNCFCVANDFGLKYKDIQDKFLITLEESYSVAEENVSSCINEKLEDFGCDFYVSTGDLVKTGTHAVVRGDKHNYKFTMANEVMIVIQNTFAISSKLGIKYEEIEPKILEKNKKWSLRINKNK